MSRNTSKNKLPIRDEISVDGQIAFHRGFVRHSSDDAERSGQVLLPSGGNQHISESSNADLVFLSPSLIKSTFNGQDNCNVATIAPTLSSLINPADSGENIEVNNAEIFDLVAACSPRSIQEHLPVDTSSCNDKNNPNDNNPIGRKPKMSSPTKHGSYGIFSGAIPCLIDHGHSPNLRSRASDHDESSILP